MKKNPGRKEARKSLHTGHKGSAKPKSVDAGSRLKMMGLSGRKKKKKGKKAERTKKEGIK